MLKSSERCIKYKRKTPFETERKRLAYVQLEHRNVLVTFRR